MPTGQDPPGRSLSFPSPGSRSTADPSWRRVPKSGRDDAVIPRPVSPAGNRVAELQSVNIPLENPLIQVAGIRDRAEAVLLRECGIHYLGFPLRLPVHREDLTEAEA